MCYFRRVDQSVSASPNNRQTRTIIHTYGTYLHLGYRKNKHCFRQHAYSVIGCSIIRRNVFLVRSVVGFLFVFYITGYFQEYKRDKHDV